MPFMPAGQQSTDLVRLILLSAFFINNCLIKSSRLDFPMFHVKHFKD